MLADTKRWLSRIGLCVLLGALLSGAVLRARAAATPRASSKYLITEARALQLTTRFRAAREPGAVQAHAFHRSVFDVLLAQPGASRLRVYNARYADGRPTFVVYAADSSGQDYEDVPGNTSLPSPPYFQGEDLRIALAASTHLVTREHAETLIARFQSTAAATAVRSYSFDRSLIDELLAQQGAEGIRIYYGTNASGTEALVLYAIDGNGRDLSGLVGASSEAR